MLAEIHGKISRQGRNLSDRLEDNLTGNVFGALRYLPFSKGLGHILKQTLQSNTAFLENLDDDWASYIQFWPYHAEGEIDILIHFPTCIIGIEVKLFSSLSSEDQSTDAEISRNQLSREARILHSLAPEKEKFLIFLAPDSLCKNVDAPILSTVVFEKISWEVFLQTIQAIHTEDPYTKTLLTDITQLLKRKGFERFQTMQLDSPIIQAEDYFTFQNPSVNFHIQTTPIEKENFYDFNKYL
ncbi:hypothetical protein [Candidatus Kurthia intestinigallinarum]|uniref:hypothetical protein n=1 Tax=Candidatus Kurthia intestinigallinarum TaxID=1562256 RepID=UPI0018F73C8D|nr:hypothetical protein [Kurthia sp. 3B1D]